jgi:uncharacterized protein with PIN domain
MERFLVDVMLMRLGRWLRLLGMDVANPPGPRDRDLLQLTRLEDRTLITRDRQLAEMCGSVGLACLLIQSSLLEGQLRELAGLGLALELNPQRCTLCNGLLAPVSEELWKCERCGKLYWEGSHWRRMEETLQKIRRQES